MSLTFVLLRPLSKAAHPVHTEIVRFWRSLLHGLFDTYHPERHYMRGPGPKWHAKHRSDAAVL